MYFRAVFELKLTSSVAASSNSASNASLMSQLTKSVPIDGKDIARLRVTTGNATP